MYFSPREKPLVSELVSESGLGRAMKNTICNILPAQCGYNSCNKLSIRPGCTQTERNFPAEFWRGFPEEPVTRTAAGAT